MPDKSTSVLVEIYLNKVTCPGVILKDKSRIYISICLFGRAARSKSVSASFPLRYDENFTFQKVFFNCHDPVTLIEHFEDEDVMVELIQENDYISSGVVLATIDTSVRAFLFPASKKFLCYSSYDRAILMRRTLHFEGISPQIEFSTISTIKDIFTSAVDELEDKVKSICQETLSASKMAKNKSSPVSEQLSSTALNSGGESLSFENISNRNGIISSGSTKENQKFHKKKKTKVSNQRSHKPPFVIRKVENKPYCRPFLNSATSLDSEHVSPLSNRQSVKLKKPTSFKSVKKSKTPSSKRSDTRDAKANKEISINEVLIFLQRLLYNTRGKESKVAKRRIQVLKDVIQYIEDNKFRLLKSVSAQSHQKRSCLQNLPDEDSPSWYSRFYPKKNVRFADSVSCMRMCGIIPLLFVFIFGL